MSPQAKSKRKKLLLGSLLILISFITYLKKNREVVPALEVNPKMLHRMECMLHKMELLPLKVEHFLIVLKDVGPRTKVPTAQIAVLEANITFITRLRVNMKLMR